MVAHLLHVRYLRFFPDGTVRCSTESTGCDRQVGKRMSRDGDQLKLTRKDPDTGKRMSPEITYWAADHQAIRGSAHPVHPRIHEHPGNRSVRGLDVWERNGIMCPLRTRAL